MPRQYTPKVTRTCAHCGAIFTPYYCQVANGGGKYCSRPCYWAEKRQYQDNGANRAPRTPQTCTQCGREFLALVSRVRAGKGTFCSRQCAQQVNRTAIQIACAICGSPFAAWLSRVRRGAGKYCSPACRIVGVRKANYRGRKGKLYKVWRLAVIARDGRHCTICGKSGAQVPLHAHHVKPWARYHLLRFDVANGVTMCNSCHHATHALPAPTP